MTTATDAQLQQGLDLHRRGDFEAAEACYRRVLADDAVNADALYYLAVLACQRADFAAGAETAGRAIAIDPHQARAHKLLGLALSRLGQNDAALAAVDAALAREPDFAEAHGLRGDILAGLGRMADALGSYDRSLAIDPAAIGDWCNRGAALFDLARYEEAVANFDRVIALQPDLAFGYYNRGRALAELTRHDAALADFDTAIALDNHNADAHSNRAVVLKNLAREDEALASLDRALSIDPQHAAALAMRANILARRARHDEALATYDALLAVNPDDITARGYKSLSLLTLGEFAEGWDFYKNRWAESPDPAPQQHAQPRWDGSYCRGTLLVWGEQGLGDQILYASMIPDVQACADDVVIEVEGRLVPLFARSFPAARVVASERADQSVQASAQIPLGDLGEFFRTSWETFPRLAEGYLAADQSRSRAFRDRLSRNDDKIVGLSWRSISPGTSKTAPLPSLQPLLSLSGCRFVDLQYGDTRDDRDTIERQFGVHIEHLGDVDNTNDIDGLAALIAACDGVVTVSNTTAHLAGALGKPTWVFVPAGHSRIWYWFQDRVDSPWYPRVRLCRQRNGQSWPELMAEAAPELAEFAASL